MKNKAFKYIFLILVISFFILVVASQSGYYEYGQKRNTKMTDEAIKKFEKDLQSGKNIDIESYINTKDVNYNNRMSNLGDKCSKGIEKVIVSGFKLLFKYISNQVE